MNPQGTRGALHRPWHIEEPGAKWVWLNWAIVMIKPVSKPGNEGSEGEGIAQKPPKAGSGQNQNWNPAS